MERRRIVIATGASPSWAPRAPKEAAALSEAGYEVCILGVSGTRQQFAADRKLAASCGFSYEAADASLFTGAGSLAAVCAIKMRLKLARLLFATAHVATAPLFSPWAKKLAQRAMDMQPQLAILHLEPGLRIGAELVRSRVPIAIDMEDWYSEDLPLEARSGRPVAALRQLERMLLLRARCATCTTEAMADALAREYGCPRPTRIYNVFPQPVLPDQSELRDRSPDAKSMDGTPSRGAAVRSIHWFSQTIGTGRGLEVLFAAAASLQEPCEIHLRGNVVGYQAWLDAAVPSPLRKRVFVHAPVTAEELPARIAEHDIGFAGETASIRSRDLTATNKIFQYLQGGLAVLASDTAGQKEVAALAPGAVRLWEGANSASLHDRLRRLLLCDEELFAAKAASLAQAEKTLNWGTEKQRFLSMIREA